MNFMKSIIKLLTIFISNKEHKKKVQKILADFFMCSDKNNIYVWKIRKTAKSIGNNFSVSNSSKVNKKTIIGDNVSFRGVDISGKGEVVIGSNVVIAGNCLILTQNHNYEGDKLPYDEKNIEKGVYIGDNVWIGTNVIILPGTRIEEGAIIQAGSVVHGVIAECGIAGGNPAKVFRCRDIEHYHKLKKEKRFFIR
jgi:acetyltransferase-like isoleucine patch superfamily enzyme